MEKIDARGLACPLPVIKTKKALEKTETVQTLVDNEIAVQNLQKLAEQLGYLFNQQALAENQFVTVITKKAGALPVPQLAAETSPVSSSAYTVVINSKTMGTGAEELGTRLLQTFIYTLSEQDVLPERIIFYNSGVYLSTAGSEALPDLKQMQAQGTSIYTCGACLDFYRLTDQLSVGEITNMYRIVEIMRTTDRIITP